jgi:actin related protein 2/3 complex subunit 2
MLILDDFHYMIQDTLASKIDPANRAGFIMKIADFDEVSYEIQASAEAQDIVTVSIKMPGCSQIRQYVDVYLPSVYGGCVTAPREGFDVTLTLDLNTLTPQLCVTVAQLKRNILGSPMYNVFAAMAAGQPPPPLTVPYRKDENMYIVVAPKKQASSEDSVVVVFSVVFRDPTDAVIAEVFMREFKNARRDLPAAPAVDFSPNTPPMELEGLRVPQGKDYGFISFVLFKRHYSGPKVNEVITALTNFRSYLYYHIKCSKSYMHTRMRNRVTSSLQILRRAMPEPLGEKEKKTASGRTFTRK